ncbi:nucleotide exchange factor GrpE [Candidatus Woesearchaeota archaeon]|nr:nucleotide exchange factor GrpE [Candidatus Woesearchaeota archaeon]
MENQKQERKQQEPETGLPKIEKEEKTKNSEKKSDTTQTIAGLTRANADLTTTLKHLQADFENYKKRVDRDQEEYKKFAAKNIIANILPIMDTFDQALREIKPEDKKKEFVKGIELLYAQLYSFLESCGVKKMQSIGMPYNPLSHEALLAEEAKDAAQKNKVIEEFQPGYLMHGKVIRHAKVKIGR